MNKPLMVDKPFFCSWSGGKDSCLALYRAIKAGAIPRFLFTMLEQNGARSRSHGLPLEILKAQAQSLCIPLKTACSSWESYEEVFIKTMSEMADSGVKAGVFGDIDIESHREWEERVCSQAGMEAYLPLWKTSRNVLLDELLALGFECTIVAVNSKLMGTELLGEKLTQTTIKRLFSLGIDPSGEAGEYHTVATNGPIFSSQIKIKKKEAFLLSGHWFLDISLDG